MPPLPSTPPDRAASSMNSPRHRTKEEAERAESDNGEISLKAVAGPSVSYQDQVLPSGLCTIHATGFLRFQSQIPTLYPPIA